MLPDDDLLITKSQSDPGHITDGNGNVMDPLNDNGLYLFRGPVFP